MKLRLVIEKSNVTISLYNKNDQVIDSSTWRDDRNLLEKLLPEIDALLNKNGAQIDEVDEIDYSIDVPESYSTYRIGKAVMETLKFVKSQAEVS